jgi:hypothetical protein
LLCADAGDGILYCFRRLFDFLLGDGLPEARPEIVAPHFLSIARTSSCVSADVGGNFSIQPNGRTASMIALEWEVPPEFLF